MSGNKGIRGVAGLVTDETTERSTADRVGEQTARSRIEAGHRPAASANVGPDQTGRPSQADQHRNPLSSTSSPLTVTIGPLSGLRCHRQSTPPQTTAPSFGPAHHRRIEALEAGEPRSAALRGGHAAAAYYLAAHADDDWLCDVCSVPLTATEPILAWGTGRPSYALCGLCNPAPCDTPTVCPCAACQHAEDRLRAS